ncbi:MAG: flagellar protein FlbB [Spirochaetaceae bacterium]|nr:flagellar protein FlbB [Spirochaetaceae bacterium]
MASSGKPRILGKIIVLLLLILVLAGGGFVWFDYLNVIDAKTLLSPLYRFMGREGRSSGTLADDEFLSLDAERLAIRLEALELRSLELEKQEQDIQSRRGEIEQMAQALEERQKALDERETSFNALVQAVENKSNNVEQVARYLTGMPPQQAVGIITEMEDQDAIDVFRKAEELAQIEGTASIVSYWMSLLPADRAATLQRKMVGRPVTIN